MLLVRFDTFAASAATAISAYHVITFDWVTLEVGVPSTYLVVSDVGVTCYAIFPLDFVDVGVFGWLNYEFVAK